MKCLLATLIFSEEDNFLSLYSGFSQMHKIGNIAIIAIIANFVFPYICSFLHYLQHIMIVNEKLEVSGCKRIIFQSYKL